MSPMDTKTMWPISPIAEGQMVRKSVFKIIPFSRKIDDSNFWGFYCWKPVSYPKEQNNFLVDQMYGWFYVKFWKKVAHLSHIYPNNIQNDNCVYRMLKLKQKIKTTELNSGDTTSEFCFQIRIFWIHKKWGKNKTRKTVKLVQQKILIEFEKVCKWLIITFNYESQKRKKKLGKRRDTM
jgi:hypothetical protein